MIKLCIPISSVSTFLRNVGDAKTGGNLDSLRLLLGGKVPLRHNIRDVMQYVAGCLYQNRKRITEEIIDVMMST